MSITKQQKVWIILGVGVAALGWWYWRRKSGQSLIPNALGSGGAPAAGATSTVPTVGGTVAIDNPDIVRMRSQQTGTLSRSQCIFPNRWINTTTGPYFGKCVPPDVFPLWTQLPGDVQGFATDATYFQFMRSIGRA